MRVGVLQNQNNKISISKRRTSSGRILIDIVDRWFEYLIFLPSFQNTKEDDTILFVPVNTRYDDNLFLVIQ